MVHHRCLLKMASCSNLSLLAGHRNLSLLAGRSNLSLLVSCVNLSLLAGHRNLSLLASHRNLSLLASHCQVIVLRAGPSGRRCQRNCQSPRPLTYTAVPHWQAISANTSLISCQAADRLIPATATRESKSSLPAEKSPGSSSFGLYTVASGSGTTRTIGAPAADNASFNARSHGEINVDAGT